MKDRTIPIEWENYLAGPPYGLEIIPATLYDTEIYTAGFTTQLRFFWNPKGHRARSNMYLSGTLPNPMGFLVQHIRINGITSKLMRGAAQLVIGAKHWGVNPAWSYALKEKGFPVRPNLFIPPLVNFYFQIDWEYQNSDLGNGFNGVPVMVHAVQVVMYGQLARAIQ